MQKAERFRTELLRRGVLLVPVIWGEGDASPVLKKGFGVSGKAVASLPSIGVRVLCNLLVVVYRDCLIHKKWCTVKFNLIF